MGEGVEEQPKTRRKLRPTACTCFPKPQVTKLGDSCWCQRKRWPQESARHMPLEATFVDSCAFWSGSQKKVAPCSVRRMIITWRTLCYGMYRLK